MSENVKDSNHELTSNSNSSGSQTDVIDRMLATKEERTVDSDTLIQETQKRVWGALKKGYEYAGVVDESDTFLRKNVFSKINMMVLYVDLVGSTSMALELSGEKLAIIVSSFSQEMASLIKQFKGFVLKFAGDAVIGYFVAEENPLQAADTAVECAKSMITIVEKGINPILNQYDYPDLMVKIGIDFGQNIVVRYGSDEKQSHVDLMGPPMNIASKIQAMSRPNQILIGDDVYTKLHPSSQKSFKQIVWENNEWRYRSRITGEIYKVYEYTG